MILSSLLSVVERTAVLGADQGTAIIVDLDWTLHSPATRLKQRYGLMEKLGKKRVEETGL